MFLCWLHAFFPDAGSSIGMFWSTKITMQRVYIAMRRMYLHVSCAWNLSLSPHGLPGKWDALVVCMCVCVCLCLVVTRNLVHLWTGWLAQTTFDTLRPYGLVTQREQVLSSVTAVRQWPGTLELRGFGVVQGEDKKKFKTRSAETWSCSVAYAGVFGKPVPVWPGNLPKFGVLFLESGPERLSSLATSWMRCQKLVKQISG